MVKAWETIANKSQLSQVVVAQNAQINLWCQFSFYYKFNVMK